MKLLSINKGKWKKMLCMLSCAENYKITVHSMEISMRNISATMNVIHC